MGYDWIMEILFQVERKFDTPLQEFIDFQGCIGVYVEAHSDDYEYEVVRQMNDWQSRCPPTIVYANGDWTTTDDIVYTSPDWCGVTIKYDKKRILNLVGFIENVVSIKIIPCTSRRY